MKYAPFTNKDFFPLEFSEKNFASGLLSLSRNNSNHHIKKKLPDKMKDLLGWEHERMHTVVRYLLLLIILLHSLEEETRCFCQDAGEL